MRNHPPSASTLDRNVSTLTFLGVLLFTAVAITSCAHVAEEGRSDPGFPMPDTYSLYEETAPAPDRWWEGFGSEELNTLVEGALKGSLTLRQAYARLEQSRALAVQAGADRVPDLDLGASASETRRNADGETVTDSSRSLTLVTAYEIDFWGRLRSEHQAALLEVEASQDDLCTAALTLASEVTLKWLELLSVRQQLEILDTQIETNRTILDLIELRYLKGAASALDIYQQRQVLAESMAGIPQLEARRQTLLNDLAVLTGEPPRTDLGLRAVAFPEVGSLPETGVPADLLARRPDVRAAGHELFAARSQLRAARADRLPSVNLTATAGFRADGWGNLFDSWLASLAANLSLSLFNAGAIRAEVTRREWIADERLATYGQTVLTAILEVEEAMINEVKQVEYIQAQESRLKIAADSYREALQRYRKGLIDYLPALESLISAQRLERTVVQARFDRLSYRVKLHRALGGTWMGEIMEGKENRSPQR
ncbi:MAG: efflux transporter outer membrane subunit [bacterium]|nr:MAG: efflux transporter outer membrane subunit [bacterium]